MPTLPVRPWLASTSAALVWTLGVVLTPLSAWSQSQPNVALESAGTASGPIRLRQPSSDSAAPAPINAVAPAPALPVGPVAVPPSAAPPANLTRGEFETFVNLPRFGADLVNQLGIGATDFSPVVPLEYVIQSGDEVQLIVWGSVDADLRLTVDRSGRINIPRVGPVLLAGVRFGDLRETVSRRVAAVFRNFELSVSMGALRGVRVYVTGFVQQPGAYAVAALSTVMSAVMRAGGPAASGSFRKVELRREGKSVGTFDLYDLLLRGDRGGDRLVQPDDVILVAAVGPLVAISGSVNRQAVFELKPGEALRDVLQMAGGFSPIADRSRVAIERLDDRNSHRIVESKLPEAESTVLAGGDVLRVFSAVDSSLSVQRQNKRVRIEGEVALPGEYVLPPESTLADALRTAGGLTGSAFVYGTSFTRASVRASQQENYERALRDLETDLARNVASQRVSAPDELAPAAARSAANARLLERLRALQPSGRVVLQIASEESRLPEMLLEDGDRVSIPPRPTAIGVFGSVFNTGSYLYQPSRTLEEYLRLAGGPTKGADEASLFVVRANGQVISNRQNSTWFARGNKVLATDAVPGDTIFVPEEMDKTTVLQKVKDWTLILYQLGLGAAGINSTGIFK